MNSDPMYIAIREAVLQTIDELGIEAVRQLSWFPSSRSGSFSPAKRLGDPGLPAR